MSSTQTYIDAWDQARFQYRRDTDPAIQERATNLAVNKMWRAYDWRGTVVTLPPFWIVPNQNDYGATVAVPSDFLGLREVYRVQLNGTSPVYSEIRVVQNLEQSGLDASGISDKWAIAYKEELGVFRLHPRPGGGWAAPNTMISGTYKKLPTKITRATLASTLPFDDTYFDVFTASLAWAALVSSGARDDAMKQDMIFQSVLASATAEAGRERGMQYMHPSESLMDSFNGGSIYD